MPCTGPGHLILIHNSLQSKRSHAEIREVIPGTQNQAVGIDQSQTAQPRLPQTLDLHFGRGKLLTSRTSLFTKLWDKLKAKERGRIGLSLRDLKFLTS